MLCRVFPVARGLRFLPGKQLELMSEVVPRITRVAILRNPTNSAHAFSMMALAGPARSLGIQLHAFETREPGDFESAFAVMIGDGVKALMVLGDSIVFHPPHPNRGSCETASAPDDRGAEAAFGSGDPHGLRGKRL